MVMALQITIDIFSGRPNPVLEISGRQAREILERVKTSICVVSGTGSVVREGVVKSDPDAIAAWWLELTPVKL
jgi:hypothetical protein